MMGPKAHFIFALIFFILGRKYGDNILYFFASYGLIIGISAMIYRRSLPEEDPSSSESTDQ